MGDSRPSTDYQNARNSSCVLGKNYNPVTTSRVDVKRNSPSKDYPFSPAGKLYFRIGEDTYVCSASFARIMEPMISILSAGILLLLHDRNLLPLSV